MIAPAVPLEIGAAILAVAPARKGFTHESPVNASVEWYTPAWLFEALSLAFDLDPCHPWPRLPWVPAWRVYSLPQDGLALPWVGRVWLNPPYGKETARWLAKMHLHRHGIALVNARTDCDWFHRYAAKADAICFLRGRVNFVDRFGRPGGKPKPGKKKAAGPGCGQILIAWGEDCVRALEASGLGYTVRRAT